MLNLATLLRESAQRVPDRKALAVASPEGPSLTYRELDTLAKRFAGALRDQLGVERGKHVAIMLPNVPPFTVAYFGIHYAGATVVPINVLFTADELAYHLNDSDSVALVVWEGFLGVAQAAFARAETCRHLVVVSADDKEGLAPQGSLSFSALLAADPVRELPTTMPDDTAVILYTSGTTGRPKGAELTHFNMFFNALYSSRFLLPMDESAVALATLPLFHSFGQTIVQNGVLAAGGTVVMLPRFEPAAALAAMAAHQVNVFAGVPTMYFALLHAPEAAQHALSLRYCISGGSAMPVEVMRAFDEKYGVNILEGYGLSETSPVASFNTLERGKKPGSIGVPIWGVAFKLIDGEDVAIDEARTPGELCIQGHNVMKGYYKRPEANEEALRGGWFHTGDVAERDESGYYYIVDRKKDMVIRGGYNVYPREIEEVLYGHPAVREAAVVGIPHERHGEEIKAVVSLVPGQAVDESGLIEYCKRRLAAYKYPRTIEFRDELPKGPTGKILKRALRSGDGRA